MEQELAVVIEQTPPEPQRRREQEPAAGPQQHPSLPLSAGNPANTTTKARRIPVQPRARRIEERL
jgi:hypothetical protein